MGWSAPVLLVLLAPRPLETAPCGIGAARASPIRHQARPSIGLGSRILAFPLWRRCVRRRAMAFPPPPCQTIHRHHCPWRVRLPDGQLPHCSPRRCFPDHNAVESQQQSGAAGGRSRAPACLRMVAMPCRRPRLLAGALRCQFQPVLPAAGCHRPRRRFRCPYHRHLPPLRFLRYCRYP